MIRILAGASPVLRSVKPSIGGVWVCALGHWDRRQRLLLPVATSKTHLSHVAIWICPWVSINLHDHSLYKLGEFWKRKPVFRALSRKLQRLSARNITPRPVRPHL